LKDNKKHKQNKEHCKKKRWKCETYLNYIEWCVRQDEFHEWMMAWASFRRRRARVSDLREEED